MQTSPTPADRSRGQRIALGVLTGITFLVVAWMVAPLLVGLALGTVMGFTAQPFHRRLTQRFHEKPALAAATTTLLSGLMLIGAGSLTAWVIVRELVAAVAFAQTQIASHVFFGPRTLRLLSAFGLHRQQVITRLTDEFGRLANLAADAATVVVQTSAGALLIVVVAMWTMFYVLVDWPRIARHTERLLPLDPRHTRALVDEFRDVGRRAFVGTVASAIVQGVFSGIGFAIFGVPQPIALGAILAVMSFIPVVGSMLVWIPAALWLLTSGHVVRAVLLVAYCLIVVGAGNDYVIRPRLVGSKEGSHPLLTLVGILGGISVFGAAGVIVGPIVMALFVASAHIYERERERDIAEIETEEVRDARSSGRPSAAAASPVAPLSSGTNGHAQCTALSFQTEHEETRPMKKLSGRRVAILVCDGFEQSELIDPRIALEDEGATTDVVSPAGPTVKAWKHRDWGKTLKVDVPLALASAANYDALLLPGGVINPDRLRLYPEAIAFIRLFGNTAKPIAAICHGPWTLIDADLVRGRTMTSWPSLKVDLRNAGANWVDEEVVVDKNLVTSRKPADIGAFSRETIKLIAESAPRVTRAEVLASER